jgi:hypothetical protein
LPYIYLRFHDMAAKWTLDISAMQEDFFADTTPIGIASALPGYSFCRLLNKHFAMNFMREPELDICIEAAGGEKKYFPVYQYALPLSGGRYLVYKLKNEKEALLPEIKQLDFLWLIQSISPEADAQFFLQKLRGMADVQLAQILAIDKLKNANYLLV